MEQGRDFLRHTLATLGYRAGKVVREGPAGFESLRVAESVRTPAEILAHIGDLLDWGLAMASGRPAWRDSKPQPWDREVDRFFAALAALEKYLASDEPLGSPVEKLFQGPIADALTHTGQLALLRRMAGQPVRAENYFKADIASGRVGREQSKPKVEF
ncbi:MAG: hypothetical protein ACXVJT_05665 [Thermoanaerobaculia bacterium]